MLRGESSSNPSNASSRWTYHVFLSFRGDTRLRFTDYLYAALQRKGIITFRDDKQLERGDVIKHELLNAIEESLAAIVVLSENYASSTWCLDELQKILESKRVLGREVFPVFYDVSPSDVRYQRNSFAEAFRKHATRFKEDKVQNWRDSLRDVAGISGWESKNEPEAELIEDIVEKVHTKLQSKLPSYNDGVVGIDSRVKEMDSLLSRGSRDVRFIGIWGMGGIGKTTLARVIYDRIRSEFEIFCFLDNVREVSKRSDGLLRLQRKLLSCQKIRNLEIDDLHDGKKMIRNLLSNKNVLLVLDDISCLSQLENLAKNQEWFGPGSRVIITTRDEHFLTSHGVCEKYKMETLNHNYSFQLFSQEAFKGDQPPPEGCLEFSKTMVQYAGGLPLALKVLGSFLCGRTLSEWEEAVAKIKQVPPNEILKTLRISYDGLEDAEKTMFLDIAFFFKGQKKVKVIQILKDCGLYPTIGINLLIEKSLVTCHHPDGGILEMHDLLQEMGRNVVFQESPNDASKRSRLCSLEDINQVLSKNKGTELIQGIILMLSEPCEAYWDPEAFSKMCNLRVLIILCDLHLPLGLKCLSSSLKILEWKGYPLQDLPLGLQLDELVHLKMRCSNIKRLWNGTQFFRKLKSIDLSYSRDLIKAPNIFGVPCLERLVLKGCINLVKVHQSVAQHKNLAVLNLKGCINLKTLPTKLEMNALKEFILSGCSKVKKLPEFGENMECLFKLNLNGCENLVCLPQSIRNLKFLGNLKLSGCSKLFGQPNNLTENNALEALDESETAMREVPSSLRKDLKLLPLSGFSALKELNLRHCNLSDESIPDDLGGLSSLEELYLSGNNFVNLEACIANLSRLIFLDLDDCRMLQTLPVLPASVRWLFAANCTQMAPILFDPQRIWKFFEPSRWNQYNPFWFMIPGREIPPWFDNQDNFPLNPYLTDIGYDEEYNLIASIIVDIPDYYRSSEWWGIAVCLSLENTVKRDKYNSHYYRSIQFRWASKVPDTDMDSPLSFNWIHNTHFTGQHLYITIFSSVHGIVKPYLKSGQNKLQLILHAVNYCKCGKLKMRNCGSRVVCKEDAQAWSRGQATSEVDMPSNSIVSTVLNQSRITEITNESLSWTADKPPVNASNWGGKPGFPGLPSYTAGVTKTARQSLPQPPTNASPDKGKGASSYPAAVTGVSKGPQRERVHLVAKKMMTVNYYRDNPLLPDIDFSPDFIDTLAKRWENSLVIKLLGRTVGYQDLRKLLPLTWQLKGGFDFELLDLGYDCFLVRFAAEAEYERVLNGGPYVLFDHYLTIRAWTKDFIPSEEVVNKTLVWVRFPELNVLYYDEDVLEVIASIIGEPHKIGTNAAEVTRGRFARVCVEVDLTKPLVGRFRLMGRWQMVEYEALHPLCTTCGTFGHTQDKCPKGADAITLRIEAP